MNKEHFPENIYSCHEQRWSADFVHTFGEKTRVRKKAEEKATPTEDAPCDQ